MTHGVLPHKVEVRTLAARAVELEGYVDLAKLPRLEAAVTAAGSPVTVSARFFRDEENRYAIDLAVAVEVTVICQRCLGPLEQKLESRSLLAVLWSDEQVGQLPPRYDPVITEAEMDLWGVIEDELLLVLPSYSYHSDRECGQKSGVIARSADGAPTKEPEGKKENPFSVLLTLKEDGDD